MKVYRDGLFFSHSECLVKGLRFISIFFVSINIPYIILRIIICPRIFYRFVYSTSTINSLQPEYPAGKNEKKTLIFFCDKKIQLNSRSLLEISAWILQLDKNAYRTTSLTEWIIGCEFWSRFIIHSPRMIRTPREISIDSRRDRRLARSKYIKLSMKPFSRRNRAARAMIMGALWVDNALTELYLATVCVLVVGRCTSVTCTIATCRNSMFARPLRMYA